MLNAANLLEIIQASISSACTREQAPCLRVGHSIYGAGMKLREADSETARDRLCNEMEKADINTKAASSRVAQEQTIESC